MDAPLRPHFAVFHFLGFRLIPRERVLEANGIPVRLSSRAFDLLVVLVERAGQVVGKQELIDRVWQSTVVDDANLRVQISTLRKLLREAHDGPSLIKSVAGTGYRFTAPVQEIQTLADFADLEAGGLPSYLYQLPPSLDKIFGRESVISALSDEVTKNALISIVGAGGVGKSTVAIAIAENVSQERGWSVVYLDLAVLSDSSSVLAMIEPALRSSVWSDLAHEQGPIKSNGESVLIVLDGCEHLVADVCALVETIDRLLPEIHVLTTSREPLRALGERVHRLQPLDLPASTIDLTREKALCYSAIQLFDERARARDDQYKTSNENARLVAEICRKLDGLPLAIELAAARASASSLDVLLHELDDRFRILTSGRRTALARHQTLLSTFDWSYQLLPAFEQKVLRRLAVFRRSFSLDAALAVLCGEQVELHMVTEAMADLADKSLLVVDAEPNPTRYRLLDSTRAYALEQLYASNERDEVGYKHALHFLSGLKRTTASPVTSGQLNQELGGYVLDELRWAIDWALNSSRYREMSATLAINAAGLWFGSSLIQEYQDQIRAALENLDQNQAHWRQLDIGLRVILAYAKLHGDRAGASDAIEAFQIGLSLAKNHGYHEHKRDSAFGLCIASVMGGRYELAHSALENFDSIALGSPLEVAIFHRASALAHSHSGGQKEADLHLEEALQRVVVSSRLGSASLKYDHVVAMLTLKARVLWLRGHPERALAVAEESVSRAMETEHELSIGYALSIAGCGVASWAGADEFLRSNLDLLASQQDRSSFHQWRKWVECFEMGIARRAGVDIGFSIGAIDLNEHDGLLLDHCAVQHHSMVTSEAIRRAANGQAGWATAEILRGKGELILSQTKGNDRLGAEDCFKSALKISANQGALSFELRAATSLASLWLGAKNTEALALLHSVYDKFSEGFMTRDLTRAREVISLLVSGL